MNLNGLRTWVINLDRAVERLAHISAQLEPLSLPWTRFSAVDARHLSQTQKALLDERAFKAHHGTRAAPGELGCYLSHIEVMRAFLGSEAEFALILEDDVIVHASLPEVLKGLMQQAHRWDMVKLSAVHSGTPQPVLEVANGHHLAVMLSQCTGSSAYLINRHAAARYVAGLLPMHLPYDHAFDRGWQLKLKVRMVTPTPCTHYEGLASSMSPVDSTRKLAKHQRLPTYWFRLCNELQRVKYGLWQTHLERQATQREAISLVAPKNSPPCQ